MIKSISSLLLAIGLMLMTATLTRAWPEEAPVKATIRGQGIEGEVQITDAEALNALKLGATEDFAHGPIPMPKYANAYVIRRWFYGGGFEFGQITYYPMPRDSRGNQLRGYVFFEDGPQIEGHTSYDKKWFYATPEGDAALKKLLTRLGVALPDANGSAAPEPPARDSSPAEGAPSAKGPADSYSTWLLAAEILIALGAGASVLLFLRARAGR